MSERLIDWIAHRASVLAGAEAVATSTETLTYGELDTRVDATAAALGDAGVGAGDRVALLCRNSLEMVEAVHALPRLGAVLVLLNARLGPEELAWQLRDADVRCLVAHAPTAEVAGHAAALASLAEPLLLPLRSWAPFDRVMEHAPREVHSILYTSGTTGAPKGAMLTYGNFWASAIGSAFNLGVLPGDRWLACMPLFHVGGLSILLRSAIYGTSMVVHEEFDAGRVARAIDGGDITLVSMVATMLQRVLDSGELRNPGSLRAALLGGGPVPLPLLERALALGIPVVQTYGLTESASQVATLVPGDAVAHAGSAGKPLLTTRLRVDAPRGEPGEILVAGPTVTAGYFRRPEATAAAIREGWLHTGDIGRLDEDGYLYVLDRRDDLIVSGGENVYPAEVEAALLRHPAVLGAAVVGLPDERWGQSVAAAVVLGPGAELTALEPWLRGQLAGYKQPRRYLPVDALPTTASGKVQRHRVRELFDSAGD